MTQSSKWHSKEKEKQRNKIRDDELLKRFNIQVHRIPVYNKKKRMDFVDILKEDEILGYYFKHMPEVIA